MQVFPSVNQFRSDPTSSTLLDALQSSGLAKALTDSLLYHSFPIYRDDEGGLVVADCVLLSPQIGVVVIAALSPELAAQGETTAHAAAIVEQVPSYVHSRLIKNRSLRETPTKLAFDIHPVVFSPSSPAPNDIPGASIANSGEQLQETLTGLLRPDDSMSAEMFNELVATIEGAKGLIRPKSRDVSDSEVTSKGSLAAQLEAAITVFDQRQKIGMMGRVSGPQRIRGLAGSGKTVVLAMKAAQVHLQEPDAKIAYTFYTKSLYQHVKRLITRFYRQFDDRDPDWDRCIHVLHGWGGANAPGFYSTVCERHGVRPLSFRQAAAAATGDKFDYACTTLAQQASLQPVYDYVFVDEGQDFPLSFMRLCHRVASDGKFVLAYDDLQTIFQATTPSTAEIFGTNASGVPLAAFDEDIVLHKCYRNPREILVAAHALGFGIYGDIVQMIESREHWEDVGYTVNSGDFEEGSEISLERPESNSLTTISDHVAIDEIVSSQTHADFESEVSAAARGIKCDIDDGLKPDDVLVVTVDDRNAKTYLRAIEQRLAKVGVACNNLHEDSFGIQDFMKEGRVTLSTVHKAKGNEAFMVYVVGVDAVLERPTVRKRNMLFTAMTRAKGWVRMSGIGPGAKRCDAELASAKAEFPCLRFTYPGPEELKVMRRDLAEAADKKLKARRLLDQLREDYTEDEIDELLKETAANSSQRNRRKRK